MTERNVAQANQRAGAAGARYNFARGKKAEFESPRLQLLNFEAANQSIFHSMIPIGFGVAFLREDSRLVISVSEEDEESDTDEDGMESASLSDESARLGVNSSDQ